MLTFGGIVAVILVMTDWERVLLAGILPAGNCATQKIPEDFGC
jgi:hypothetical protein